MLHKTISAIRAETWEAINRTLLASARQEKLEDGSIVRLDSTVTAALMHEPSDSSLLWDAVRVMVRLLKQAQAWMGDIARAWRDHRRAANKRWRAIESPALRLNALEAGEQIAHGSPYTNCPTANMASQANAIPPAHQNIMRPLGVVGNHRPFSSLTPLASAKCDGSSRSFRQAASRQPSSDQKPSRQPP